ncbi:UMP kinase [Candidatus Pacearchaeota archaeon]|jgi:uridylate kinase|nr:UMP kinase [Candidatus Pacearchaeota archaeon]|tara:strand:- start:17473 stop:18159 length:687 start_codon:yes stop_codon:yes gene_type:complete
MKKRIIVLSLGGSLIIPDRIDIEFLKKFKKIILKNTKKYKFVIVCGGGGIARKYIHALEEIKTSEKNQSLSGISATRMNARFMGYFFNTNQDEIPLNLKTIKKQLKNKNIIFNGALGYKTNQTTDSTAAKIAKELKTDFINLTNIYGLHNKNPLKYKNAKFIPKINWEDFNKMANKFKFKPGQHFVLDQTASLIILKNKIKTYIIGKDLMQLDSILNNKKFKGTIIYG